MIPSEVKNAITALGADQVAAHFSGGNDEGGYDEIKLVKEGETVTQIDSGMCWEGEGWQPWEGMEERGYTTDKQAIPVAEFLEGVLVGRYGGFGGEGYVNGTVMLDVATNKVGWKVTEQQPVYNEWSE